MIFVYRIVLSLTYSFILKRILMDNWVRQFFRVAHLNGEWEFRWQNLQRLARSSTKQEKVLFEILHDKNLYGCHSSIVRNDCIGRSYATQHFSVCSGHVHTFGVINSQLAFSRIFRITYRPGTARIRQGHGLEYVRSHLVVQGVRLNFTFLRSLYFQELSS